MIDLEQIEALPHEAGVYLMRNSAEEIVYIGKAIDIQKRIRSHCSKKGGAPASPFVIDVKTIDYVITANAREALILEDALIKEHQPIHNIKLKDDKRFPYIKITLGETFPRAYLTRTVERDGSRYFGPYTHVTAARRTLAGLHEILPMRTCKYPSEDLIGVRPCVEYEMGRCCAPCGSIVTAEEYRDLCEDTIEFLKGNNKKVTEKLEIRMRECSEAMHFEKAAFYRDILHAATTFTEKQTVARDTRFSEDYLGYGRAGSVACMHVLKRRTGKIVATTHHFLDGTDKSGFSDIYISFIEQYYGNQPDIPRKLVLPISIPKDLREAAEFWISDLAEHKVVLHHAQRGAEAETVAMAQRNSVHKAEQRHRKLHGLAQKVERSVIALQEALGLERPPLRIEGYDISNTQGTEIVASMVVFQDGRSLKSGYRHFKIQGLEGPDDFESMRQVLRRRLTHGKNNDKAEDKDNDNKNRFASPPDLILIDGGKGQLSSALEILEELHIQNTPLCSLAKKEEEIFLPDEEEPIRLDLRHEGLQLLQRVRDEAHRFAITYHRKRRGKSMQRSALSQIRGVGPATERKLLKHFGSLKRITAADVSDIAAIPGMAQNLAERIYRELHREEQSK